MMLEGLGHVSYLIGKHKYKKSITNSFSEPNQVSHPQDSPKLKYTQIIFDLTYVLIENKSFLCDTFLAFISVPVPAH